MRYRQKSKYVTAEQWRPGIAEIGAVRIEPDGTSPNTGIVHTTLSSEASRIFPGDYIVVSDAGTVRVIGREDFERDYEPA